MEEKANDGCTAAQYAAREGHAEALRALLAFVRRQVDEQDEEEESGSCSICLENDAWWIFDSCGHKCVCKTCMRKQKEKSRKATPSARGNKGKKGSTMVACPLCRVETRVVQPSDYARPVFE